MSKITENVKRSLMVTILLIQPVGAAKFELNEAPWASDNAINNFLYQDFQAEFAQKKSPAY